MEENKQIQNQADVEIKEEFRTGISDAELVVLIKGWIEESKSYYEIILDVIKKNVEYYLGNQTEVHKIRGKNSKAVENRVFMATETIIPIITSQPPDMVAQPANDDEQANINANLLQKSLMYHYERIGLKEISESWVRNLILKRFAVYKMDWSSKDDDLCVKSIDPKRIRMPKFGATVNDKPYILEELEMSYKGVKDFFGQKYADELLKQSGGEEGNPEVKKRKSTFVIWEAWTDDFVVWMAGGNILKKQDNPWYNFKDETQNYFDSPRKPFIIKSIFQTDETLVGDTDLVTQVIPMQDNINKRKRQIENLSAKVANPPLLIDSDVMDEETAAGITNEEGLIIYGKDVAQPGKVRFETPGQVPSYLFDDLISSRTEFDNLFGTHSTTRGEKSRQPTLGQDILARQADLGRIDLIRRRWDAAIGEVAEYMTQIMSVWYDKDKVIKILGDDGEISEFRKDNIEKGAKIVVRAGNAIPTDEVSQRAESVNLFQLGVLDPLSLYEKLKYPNPVKTFSRLAQFRSGQMFAEYSGQGAAPAQSGMAGQATVGQMAGAPGTAKTPQEVVQQGRQSLKQ